MSEFNLWIKSNYSLCACETENNFITKKRKRKRNVHRLFIYKVSIPEIVQYFESLFRTMKCVLSMEVISGVINVMSVTADNPIKKKTHMTKISEKKGKGSLSPF